MERTIWTEDKLFSGTFTKATILNGVDREVCVCALLLEVPGSDQSRYLLL